MKVLFVAAEGAPFAKVGGLADVVGALPKALRAQGVDARIILPGYRMVQDDPRWTLAHILQDLPVQMNSDWQEHVGFLETEVDGVPVGFITSPFFEECVDSATLYGPGYERHLLFSAAALRVMETLDWIPDIVHAHDWHTGFLPVLLSEARSPYAYRRRDWGGGQPERWRDTRSVFTIHNLAYQGVWDRHILGDLGLADDLFSWDKLETWGRVNFLKSGMVFADQVNTVSPNYAQEIQTERYGEDLHGVTRHLAEEGRLSGILNGIDTEHFNPETDRYLAERFWPSDPSGKETCRRALRLELGLPELPDAPVIGMVGRLSHQKGLDLVLECLEDLAALPAQLVVLGSGDPAIATAIRRFERSHPEHVRMVERFDEGLAQRIYGGSDLFLMPSHFEPCGLGQLIAMRYGTLPIVRATGGLKDTVLDNENGFVFSESTTEDLKAALTRATRAWLNPGERRRMMQNAMTGRYGWEQSAGDYVDLYERALGALQPLGAGVRP